MSFSLSQVKGRNRRWKVGNKQEVSSSDEVAGRYCTQVRLRHKVSLAKPFQRRSIFFVWICCWFFLKESLWGVLTACPSTATSTQFAPSRSGHMFAGVQVRNRGMKKLNLMDLFLGWRFKVTSAKSLPQGGALCSSLSQALAATWMRPRWMTVNLRQHLEQRHSRGFTQTVRHTTCRAAFWPGTIHSKQFTQRK